MMSVIANAAKVSDNVVGIQMVSSAILSESMVSEPDAAFLGSLAALVSTNSNAIASSGLAAIPSQIASNSAAIASNASTYVANSAAIASNATKVQANKIPIFTNCQSIGGYVTSFGLISFQVSDNLVSNKRHDTEIASNRAAIALISK